MRPRLIRTLVGCCMLLAAWAPRARPAQAFESTAGRGWDPAVAAIVTTSFLVDLGFSGIDLGYAIHESPLPRTYGAAELLLTVPQTVLFAPAALDVVRSGDRREAWILVLTAWPMVLAGHGAWTLVRPRPAGPPREQPRRARQTGVPWAVSPAVLGGGGRHPRPVASLVLQGRF